MGTFFILEFLYTGLFITCHDAMHGVISYRHRQLNNSIGKLCITAYAWFDYQRLYQKHWRHHNHTGIVERDPDYHDGQRISLFFCEDDFVLPVQKLTKEELREELKVFQSTNSISHALLANDNDDNDIDELQFRTQQPFNRSVCCYQYPFSFKNSSCIIL
ncbi:unnamed protein product [Rotaria sp. Silwood1]|nr:unnamed protein product [Rotaria sp. Silwood1]